VIGGNGLGGVAIHGMDDATNNNQIAGNRIGSYLSYNIGNSGPGIDIQHANNNFVGYPGTPIMQYIANNFGPGIRIQNAQGNFVTNGNTIGSLGANYGPGVLIDMATASYIAPDLISYNAGAGVVVSGSASLHNAILPKADYNNDKIAIDLGNDGFTPNGTHSAPGPNNWLPYPVITSFAGHVLSGIACANCFVNVYQVKDYPASALGGVYVQQTTANGAGAWSTTLPAGLNTYNLTLTAMDVSGNTSEMSLPPQLFLPLIKR